MSKQTQKIPVHLFRSMQPKRPAAVPIFGPRPLSERVQREAWCLSFYALNVAAVVGLVSAPVLISDRLSRFDHAFYSALNGKDVDCPKIGDKLSFSVPNGILYSAEKGQISITKAQCPSTTARSGQIEGITDKGEPVRATIFYRPPSTAKSTATPR